MNPLLRLGTPLLTVFAPVLTAQTEAPTRQPDPRLFLPLQYTGTGMADLEAMREAGIVDLALRSPAALLLGKFEDEFGFAMEELDRIRFGVRDLRDPELSWHERRSDCWILQGTEEVCVAALADAEEDEPTLGTLAERPSYEADAYHSWVEVATGTVVYTGTEWAKQVLRGETKGGVPSDELMELVAWPGRPLLAMAGTAPPRDELLRVGMDPVPRDWLTEDDVPTALRFRMDQEEENLVLAAMVRFETGDAGPARFESKLEEWFEEIRGDRRLRAMGIDLASVSTDTEGRDLSFRIDLGAKGQAVLALAQFALLSTRNMSSSPQAEVIVEPAPAPETKPAGDGKKD